MTAMHYEWTPTGEPPPIKQHSIAKHEILKAYLLAYIQTLASYPFQDTFKLTLIDGFAGGGVFKHENTGKICPGSPLIMLNAIKEADFIVNQNRNKKLNLDIDYFFIEAINGASERLKKELSAHGYNGKNNIFLFNDQFENKVEDIIFHIKKKSPTGRSIFLLDQYGYKTVPLPLIKRIMSTLPGAEVILTFAVDSFLNFASDEPITRKLLADVGIPNILRGRSIEEIKRSEKDWRLFIQSCLYQDLVTASGARFYTPFFIRSSKGHGDYWFLHFSQHHRARDVMARIHWEKNNHFIHYGAAGLDMFMTGYVPEHDSSFIQQADLFGYCFDSDAKQASQQALSEEIPHLVYADHNGLTFGELFSTTCNYSPASAEIYKESLGLLISQKDLEVVSQSGTKRRSGRQIHDTDQILPPRQRTLFFL